MHGIDVSRHQGFIDWQKIKNSGLVDFAILRVGHSLYDGGLKLDERFKYNAAACEALNIPFGAYFYSYDKSSPAVKISVENVVETVKNYKMTYPLIFDIEDAQNVMYDAVQNTLLVKTAMSEIEKYGYYAMLYSFVNFFKNYLVLNDLKMYDKWVAYYPHYSTQQKRNSESRPMSIPHGMWQYTNYRTIDGIKTVVDCNYSYKNYPAIIKYNHLNGW